jgi:hypothetical protein
MTPPHLLYFGIIEWFLTEKCSVKNLVCFLGTVSKSHSTDKVNGMTHDWKN